MDLFKEYTKLITSNYKWMYYKINECSKYRIYSASYRQLYAYHKT